MESQNDAGNGESLLDHGVALLEHEIAMVGPLLMTVAEGELKTGAAGDGQREADSAPEAGVSEAWPPLDRLMSEVPGDSPLHAMQTLEEVAEYVANTVLIPLDAERINPVFGVGNPRADLLVIGEAPGAEEDKKGEPFVGRAGKLLDKILKAIGFDRGDVYIANILKSRPPNNRNPSPVEITAHFPVLLKQISLLQPKLILCVGRTAGTSLLGVESSLSALRGAFHDFHGIPTLVTYHPAALLRNPNWKPATWEDVKMLRARYDELTA